MIKKQNCNFGKGKMANLAPESNSQKMGQKHLCTNIYSYLRFRCHSLSPALSLTLIPSLPPSLAQISSRKFKGLALFVSAFIFHICPFRSLTLKTRTFRNNCIYEINQKVTMYVQGKAQKRHKKTFGLYLRLILSIETAYTNQKQ